MNKSLSLKVNSIIAVVMTLLLLAFSAYDYSEQKKFREKELKNRLEILSTRLPTTLSPLLWNFNIKNLEKVILAEMKQPDLVAIYVSTSNETLIAAVQRDNNNNISQSHTKLPKGNFSTYFIKEIKNKDEKLGNVEVYLTNKYHLKREQDLIMNWVIKIVILLLCANITLITILKYIVIKPIKIMTSELQKVEKGQFNSELVVKREDELGMMYSSFTYMRKAINQQIDILNHEIGNRKQIQRMLSENEEHLRITLNSIGDAVIATDIDGKITSMNPVAEDLTGWSIEEALDNPLTKVFKIIDTRTRKEIANPIDNVKSGPPIGLSNHTMLLARNGDEHQISDSAAPIVKDGKTLGTVLVFRDVTEEYAMRQQLEQMSFLVNSATTPIAMSNLQQRLIFANPAFVKAWGFKDEKELIGLHETDLFIVEERLASIIDAVEKRGGTSEEAEARRKDGTVFPVEVSASFVFDKEGTPVAIMTSSTDITERKRMEQAILQIEKMKSVGGLAAGMAHEINNPLAAITQGIQNIQRRLDPKLPKNIEAAKPYNIDLEKLNDFFEDRKITAFLDGGKKAVGRAATIVKNMLMFSRKSSSEHVQTDLVQLIDHTIELGSTDYDMKKRYDFKFIEIIKEYDTDLPLTNCCHSEIEQVLLNLFKNALQAMEELKSESHKPLFHIRLIKESDFVRIEVEDNGPGISKRAQQRIFEPFYTTKPAGVGTGLGLSVSYMIITQSHGGTFEVESEKGKGAKFIMRLPIQPKTA